MPCPIGTDVERAATLLREGGLVAFATETVYGLGADALNPRAVARVFEVKNRPHFDPIIVHVAGPGELVLLVSRMPEHAAVLAERFWPGPLTLVLPKTEIVPDLVTAGLSTVAVRVPDHPGALALLRAAKLPIAAPSANPFGCVSPTRAEHVAEQLGDRIDYLLDGGPCRVGVESTVLDLSGATPVLLRPGGLPVEEIEAAIGPVALKGGAAHDAADRPLPAPGMLPRHYAPRTPLVLWPADSSLPTPAGEHTGLLAFGAPADASSYAAVEVLSETGSLTEAAANFFAALRRLDARGLEQIVAETFPEAGLGRALNDRLRRAAEKA